MTESRAKATAKWKKKNPDKHAFYLEKAHQKVIKKTSIITDDILQHNPCVICGEPRRHCLQFHHLDPSTKEHPVSSYNTHWQGMLKEAARCVVLCCNCHSLHHYGDLKIPEYIKTLDVSKYHDPTWQKVAFSSSVESSPQIV